MDAAPRDHDRLAMGLPRPIFRACSPPPARRSPMPTSMRPTRSTTSSARRLAFVLLGVVALGTLAAALVHGPALAGLGLVGAFITPLIVSTEQAELLGALSLSRRGHRRRLRACPRAAVALARRHRGRGERALGFARASASCRARPACLPCRRRLTSDRAPDRLGLPVRARRRAGRDRPRLIRRARRLSVRRDAARARDRP